MPSIVEKGIPFKPVSPFFLHFGPRITQADDTVDNEFLCRRVFINDKIALPQKLEPVSRFKAGQPRLTFSLRNNEAVGIQPAEKIGFIVVPFRPQ